jgi:hypothetical protein
VTCRPSAASSPVSAGSISASSEPDGTAASRSSGTPSASESSPSIGPMFPDLETSRPLTGQGSNGLTFWPEASLASRSVSLGAKRGLPTIVGFGPSLPPPFAYYSRTSSSWRTSQGSWLATVEWGTSLAIWPTSGMTRSGVSYQLPMSERLTSDDESGSWPTPTARDHKDSSGAALWGQKGHLRLDRLPIAVRAAPGMWPTPQAGDDRDRGNLSLPSIRRRARLGKQLMLSMVVSLENGALNPTWVEWLMGFPLGWTDSGPSATRSSRKSSRSSERR